MPPLKQLICQMVNRDFLRAKRALCAIFAFVGINSSAMRYIITLILIVYATTPSVVAQQRLSFDEVVALAMEHSDMLEGHNRDIATAMYERRAARGLYLPKVEIVGAYMLAQRDIDIELNGKKGVVETSAKELISKGITTGLLSPEVAQLLRGALSPLMELDWRYTIQKRSFGAVAAKVSIPIYAGGRIRVANRVASIRLMAEEYRMDMATSKLVTTLVEQYYGVVLLQYAVAVRESVVDAVNAHLEDVKEMERVGAVAHSVVLEVEFKLAEAERALLQEQHKLSIAQRALRATVNVDFDIEPTDRLFVYKDISSLDYYVDNALELNPILCGAELNIDLANEGVKAARAELLPTVAAIGEGSLYSHNLTTMLPRWIVGVEASVLLFNGLNKNHLFKAAKSRAEGVLAKVEKARSDILLLTEQEYYNVVNSLSDIEASRSMMLFAESYYNSAYEGFKEGVTTATQLLDAEVERAASHLSYLNATYNYCVAIARLLEASGLSHTLYDIMDNSEIVYMENSLVNQ